MEHLSHFGLSRDPFANDSLVSFYFEDEAFADAERRLLRGATQGKGLCLLTGPGGSGKTMLVRHLLESLEEETYESVMLIPMPGVSDGRWILDRFARQLGVEEPAEEPGKLEKKAKLPPVPGSPVAEPPSLKKSDIQGAIKGSIPKIKSCFAQDSVESGNVSVRVTIDGKGKVIDAKVKHSNVKPAVESCVLLQVKMVKFPAPPDGEPFKFSYPFTYVK